MPGLRRVHGWAGGTTDGCTYYRMIVPLQAVQDANPDTAKITVHHLLPTDIEDYDVLVGQRIVHPTNSDIFQNFAGLKVFELDDDLFSIHPTNAGPFRVYSQAWVRDQLRANIAKADVVTTTTDHLAERLSTLNPNVVVLPNCLPPAAYALEPVSQDAGAGVAVGWAGGDSHAMDLAYLRRALGRVLGDLGPTKASMRAVGCDYGREAWGVPEGVAYDFAGGASIVEGGYYDLLTFQVGLAPLALDKFNLSKSPLKVMEYMVRGIVPVASKVGPYAEVITHGEDGFLCNSDAEWRDAISTLVTDDALRASMALKALDTAQAFKIADRASEWASVLL